MYGNGLFEAGFCFKRYREMPAVFFSTETFSLNIDKWAARDGGYTVISLLAMNRDMFVTNFCEISARKFVIGAFRFLKTENVGRVPCEKSLNQRKSQPNRIDVPCSYDEAHRLKRLFC
jgi:hypothetical protein